MAISLLELDVDGETYEARLNTPEASDTDTCVLVLPGGGHGPFGDIFDITAYELAQESVATYRFETWTTADELRAKSFADFHAELDAAIAEVGDRGYDRLFLLAKSFGGRIGLTHDLDAFERVLGWAPAVRLADESNFENHYDTPLGETEDLQLDAGDVAGVDAPVRILRGNEDEVVSADDAERLTAALADAELREIPGEDHSFNENRTTVVAETLDYLVPDGD
ncbi:alpha/beta hydrolase [Haloarchaeobius baliensis]|uniref:alpha/beta hydrolase n=1 Tax=Haloarchaeobius baliensis TaxID=1670458 RepID=UPI003F88439A